MRLILESHPRFQCFDESTAYAVLAGDVVPHYDDRRPVFKIPRFTEQIDAAAWQDFGAPKCAARYGGQPLLFMVRDPRDVVASMLDLAGGIWYNVWVSAILNDRAKRDHGFAKRWQRDLAFAESTPWPREVISAFYWLYKTEALERYRAASIPAHVVLYEDLVSTPEHVLRNVLKVLGDPWDSGVLAHHRFPHVEVTAEGMTVGNTDPSRPIEATGIGRWRSALDPEAAALILGITFQTWSRARTL